MPLVRNTQNPFYIRTHPIYPNEWCIMGPAPVGEGESNWYGPDTLMACLEALPPLKKVLGV